MIVKRRKTKKIKVGSLYIGGNAQVAIQSMAKTDTGDVKATVAQIKRMEKAGCEIVRVAVKTKEAAYALKDIKKKINIPLVADIHFNPGLAILAMENGADKIRINPGNIKDKKALIQIVKLAKHKKLPIRIGLNSGSVPRVEDMLRLAARTIKLFERHGFYDIIISLKASSILKTVEAYRKMANLCKYPFHLGITATGLAESGTVKSSISIGSLLLDGIGDTIRVSLTADPVDEIRVAKTILSSLKIRMFGPEVISCPRCGRCQVDLEKIVKELTGKIKKTSGRKKAAKDVVIAVMGCEVNGPGEAREADIGIAAGNKSGILFKKGKVIKKIKEKDFVKTIINELKR